LQKERIHSSLSVGKRKPYTIYVDKRVYRRFKPIAEEMFGSVSKALEAYMYAEIMDVRKMLRGEGRKEQCRKSQKNWRNDA